MKTTSKQNILVLAIAAVTIVVSVVVTLYASGMLYGGSQRGQTQGYQNITFTDAVLACRKNTEAEYSDRIQNLVTDNHSSRFDNSQFIYKIFMQMDLYDNKNKGTKLYYINCFVRSSNGGIRKYEVFVDDDEKPSQVNDGTNMFGMPKRK